MGDAGSVDAGEVFADLACALHESVAVGALHFQVGVEFPRRVLEHEDRAALVLLSQQGDNFLPRSLEVDEPQIQVVLEGGIELEQAEHFGTARAVVGALARVLEAGFQEEEAIAVHGKEVTSL